VSEPETTTISTGELIELAAGSTAEELEKRFGRAVLVGAATTDDEDHWSFQTRAAVGRRAVLDELSPLRRDGVVHAVRKVQPGAFAETVLIGRARSNDVCIGSPNLSKLHARIRLEADGGFALSDSGSKNGTSVNGKRLEPKEYVALKHGDEIRFGTLSLRFYTTSRLHRELIAHKARGG